MESCYCGLHRIGYEGHQPVGEVGEGDGPAVVALKPPNGQLVVDVTQLVLKENSDYQNHSEAV